jgi:dienelactone hydrolase
MKLLHITLLLASGLLGCALTVAIAQDSAAQGNLPSPPVPRPQIPQLPVPAGPFGVGRIGYEWIDTSRSDMHSADPLKHRDLMVYLWYPSPKRESGKLGVYLPGAIQMNGDPTVQPAMKAEFEGNWPFIVSGAISSHAIERAPVAKAPNKFPVVIFCHGNGGSSFEYTSLIEDMVSRGYVVAAVENTYVAAAVVFPDGRIIAAYHEPEPAGLSPEERFQRMVKGAGQLINTGASDVNFVMNKLTALNDSKAQNFTLGGRLDLNRVAAMGHSSGGANATLACELDARFKACLSLEGQMPPIAAFPENPDGKMFTQPVLLLEVDHSGQRRGFNDAQNVEYLKKKEDQLNKCPAGSYDVLLKSAGLVHASFSDYPLLAANGQSSETELALHNLRLTESFILAFLDKNLKHAHEPLLDGEANHLEATVTRYGR